MGGDDGARQRTPQVSCTTDDGMATNRSLAQMVALAFLGPMPTGHHLSWKDGDAANCAAANLEWRRNLTNTEKHRRWKEGSGKEVLADPNHHLHGRRSGYQAGCRCAKCVNWKRLYTRGLETRKTIEEVEETCGKTAR